MSQPASDPPHDLISEGAVPRHRVDGEGLPRKRLVRGFWKGLQKAFQFAARGSLYLLAIELFQGGESNDQIAKAYGVQPNKIGKSQRVRNDA